MFLMPSTWALRIPMVMNSWGTMPRAPRRFFGEISPRYMGTTLEDRPGDGAGPSDTRKHCVNQKHFNKDC